MNSHGVFRLSSAYRHLFSTYNYNKYRHIFNFNKSIQFKFISKNSNIANEVAKTKSVKKNANIEKDKLLFYYENPGFYKMLNIFALVQFLVWLHLANFTFSTIKDVKTPDFKKLPWWQKINYQDKTTRVILSAVCIILGNSILGVAWMYTMRSVRMLVLRKDHKTLSIVTYTPTGRKHFLEIPLEKVSTDQTRETAKQQLPLKVQGKWFYYILDMKKGTVHNPELFDYTAGMKRTFKN